MLCTYTPCVRGMTYTCKTDILPSEKAADICERFIKNGLQIWIEPISETSFRFSFEESKEKQAIAILEEMDGVKIPEDFYKSTPKVEEPKIEKKKLSIFKRFYNFLNSTPY